MSKYSSVALICSLLVALVQAVPEGRIIGGQTALPGQFPYQVSLKLNDVHKCGGSIISKTYVLTAAHCVIDKRNCKRHPTASLRIQAGTTHRENGGVKIPVADVIVNTDYMSKGNSADIALIKLAKPLTFSKAIQAIALSSGNVPEKTSVVTAGWGLLQHKGVMPEQLQWTALQSISQQSCSSATGHNSDKLLCLGHPRNNGVCHGDSGGPAVVDNRLVGVGSFIMIECGTEKPDLFVKVSSHLEWIKKHSDL